MIQRHKTIKRTKKSPLDEFHHILFEKASEGIIIVDISGNCTDLNPYGSKILGYSQEEIRKFTTKDILVASRNPTENEKYLLHKDGRLISARLIVEPLSDGTSIYIFHETNDLENKKEDDISGSSSFLAENPNPVLQVSATGEIRYANPASIEILEAISTKAGDFLTSHWKKRIIASIENAFDQSLKITCKNREYSFRAAAIPGTNLINLYGNDITEHERSEKALQEAERKYHNIFEYSLDGIFQSLPAGRFVTVNPALARMWGYDSPEDLLTSINNIAQQVYVNPEERKDFLRAMDEDEAVHGFEFRVYRKDGSIIWVQESVRAVKDQGGKLLYYEGTVRDITERKQAEDFLRRSEERYRRTLNNMLEGCQIVDYDWRYIYVNDAGAIQARHKPEEMLMRSMLEIYPGIEKTEMFAALQQCMGNRTPIRMETPLSFFDGDTGWFEFSVEPIPEGLFILSVEITERKRVEKELQDRETRYRTLFENLPIPVFTKDREGRYTSFNHEESKYWAKSPIGLTDDELLPPEIASELRMHDLQVLESGKPWSGEEHFMAPSGLHYSLARKVPLYDGDGNLLGILGASVDITKRKEAEKKIKQQLDRLTALSEIDRVIASSFDLSLILNQLIRQVIQQLDADAAAILLANPATNTLEHFVGKGFSELTLRKPQIRSNEDYAGKIAMERRMVHIPNLKTAEPPFQRAYLSEDDGFIAYFGLPVIAKGQVKGVMEVFSRKPFDPDEDWLSYLKVLAEQAAIAIDNVQLFNNLQQTNAELLQAYDATIEGWSYALDLRDKETEGHTRRVAEMTYKLGKKYGLNDGELMYARWGALLHDIGKMGIPDAILQKPDKLTEEEWVIMKRHPVFARNMLERIHYLKSAVDIPYCHHEKWDGSGYPRGLAGEQIPLAARIFAIADVWDALTSDRPYRPAWPKSNVLNHIRKESGRHFDPQVATLFLESEELWEDMDS